MAFFRRHMMTVAFPWRWVFALSLAVLLLWTAAGMALTPAPGTPIVNTATVQYKDAGGNPLPSASHTISSPLSGAPRLALIKTADTDPVAAGAALTYSLRYDNTGNAPATGVTVTDTLPAGVTFQSASAGGVYAPATHTITWNIGALAAGTGGTLTATVLVGAGLAVGTPIVNSASLASAETAAETASLTTRVGSGSNLVLTKTADKAQVLPNGAIAYTIAYRNLGNRDALQVRIMDPVPVNTAYIAGSAVPAASLTGNVLTWDLNTVAAGAQGTVSFQVRAAPFAQTQESITIANTATVLSTTQAGTSNTVITTVPRRSLVFLKMDTPDPVRAGMNLTYTIEMENTGAVPLTGVVLRDPLPAGTTFVSADNGGVLAAGGRQADWLIGALAVGEKKSVRLIVRTDPTLGQGSLIENTATVTTNETLPQQVRAVSGVNARTPGTVEFFDSAWQPAYGYKDGDRLYLQVKDSDQNSDPTVAETVTVVLKDLKTGDAETVVLTETGPNTGIFRNTGGIPTTFNATAGEDGTLTVAPNSRISATYTDPLDASPVSTASALIDPLGIVFDSVTGTPVAGTVVTIRNWNGVASACDLASLPVLPPGQVNPAVPTGADGRFAFPLVPPGDFCFQVMPAAGYTFPSAVADADLPAGFTIGNGSRGERFTLSVGDPPLIRDIPVDPPAGRLSITKTANKTTAAIGDLVGYSLKLSNGGNSPVRAMTITDVMPHGLQYLPGSARLDGRPLADPTAAATRTFTWGVPDLAPGKSQEITYRAVVGPDSPLGNGVNTASAAGTSLGTNVVSNTASVKVKVTGGIFTEKGTILGKVFLDRDGNRVQNQSGAAKSGKPDEPGIAGVALYLEDGTRVITDKNGKFSLLGILPGTHVLRVDETSLPKGLVLVPLSNRFLGDGASQFVAMRPGGLVQADFAVRGRGPQADEKAQSPKPAKAEGSAGGAPRPALPVPGEGAGSAVAPAVSSPPASSVPAIDPDSKGGVAVPRPTAGGSASAGTAAPEGQATLSGETRATPSPGNDAGGAVAQPAAATSGASGEGGAAAEEEQPSSQEGAGGKEGQAGEGAATVETQVPPVSEKPASRDWEEEIRTMSPELAFLSPLDGTAVVRERIRVVLKTPFGSEPSLSLNGVPVAAKQIGRRIDYEQGQVTIVEYIDIHLNAGEANLLKAELKDPFGIVRGMKQITVNAAGTPERIAIRTDKASVPADGESRIGVTVELQDRQGRIVPYAAFASVSVSAGEIIEKDADPGAEEFQIVLRDGVGSFTVRSPRETGEAVILAAIDGRQEEAKVFFAPHLRSLFLVGMGEVTIGRGRGSGAYRFLADNGWFDDGYYSGGRGAFFMKGRIFGDVLLTAAYDSDRRKRDDLFRENDTNLDAEDKYPIYGDESKTGYEAVSADKLYVKLEKNRSYLLYGDYKTDLNDTRLAAYNRSFNGLKYELNTERLKLRSFGSYTDQTQVMDALPGKGISGYYYLTKRPVVEGSERVVIEVRDRYRPDHILSRESKGRGSDYEINYDLGAVLFKGPIPSHDGDYNPVTIVVSYESKTDGEKYYLYGGRGAFKVLDGLEVGATAVVEEKAIGSYRLMGTDLTLKLPMKTVVKAEYAETHALFEEATVFNWHSDRAWLVSLESEPLEKLRLTGYYRTLGNHFLNISSVDASRGTTKYGFDAAYELRPDTRILGRFFDEKDDLNQAKHRLGSLALQTKFKKTSLTGEISNEASSDTFVPLAGTTRSPFDISQETPRELTAAKVALETELRPDLSLALSHKQNLSGDSYHMSQAGLNYQLNSQNRLYLREEYQTLRERDETRTLFGVETQLIRNAVAFNEYRLADGADGSRNQNVLGLRNKFLIGKQVTGNVSAEYLKTISGSQRSNEPDAVAASLGLEYLAKEDIKVTSRFEHRRELIDRGRDSYLGEVGLAYKLHPDYSLLLRERYFTEDAGTGGQHTTTRTMVGLAYRPLLSNRFNALAKAEYKHESNTAAVPSFREEAWILAGEGVWQATPRLQLAGKYAGKLARDGEFSSYTDLVSARFLYDLTDRWDVGAEYRILTSHALDSRSQGGAAEIGYRVVKNLWVAAGWSFDRFDSDLTGDSYQGEGPFLKLRVKFDETTLQGLRSSLPAETFTKTAGR